MAGINLAVSATVRDDGSVQCKVECGGQETTLVFDGREVFVEVPEPAKVQP